MVEVIRKFRAWRCANGNVGMPGWGHANCPGHGSGIAINVGCGCECHTASAPEAGGAMTAFPECPGCGRIGVWLEKKRPTAECNNIDCRVLTFTEVPA